MTAQRPTPTQRQGLAFIELGHPAANVPDAVGIQGGYANEAVYVMRLIDRGWVHLALTAEGRVALGHDPECSAVQSDGLLECNCGYSE